MSRRHRNAGAGGWHHCASSGVRTRELARALNVNASTISRWRRSPEFNRMVEWKRESMKARRQGGTSSTEPLDNEEPTPEELARRRTDIGYDEGMKQEFRLTENFFFRGNRAQKNFVRKELR